MTSPIRVAVTGAAGNIGYALLFRIANGDLFGPDQPVILQLLEIPPAMNALEGVAMELDDCAFPLLQDMVLTDDANTAFNNTNWALLVGARAPDVPDDRFTAMMRLDHNRAKTQIAQKAGVAVADVKKMTIWGNHSATQYPDAYHAEINGKSAAAVIDDEAWVKETFIPTVQKRGAAIIEARGQSSAASAANAAINHVQSWHHGTPKGDWVSMAIPSTGAYGSPEGVIFGYPVTVKDGEYSIVEGLTLSDFDKEKIAVTSNELTEERAAVEDMLG